VKPDVPVTLAKISEALLVQIGPEIRADYAQRSALVASMVLQCAAEEWDRAAARRAEENAALRELFRISLPAVADAGLHECLAAAAEQRDEDLRVSALDRSNDALRALLIELHAHVEEQDAPAAREAESAVWRELLRSTERRALSVSPF
jgi:hypothetical protein